MPNPNNLNKQPKNGKITLRTLTKTSILATTTLGTLTALGVFGTYKYLKKQSQQRRQSIKLEILKAKPYKGYIQKIGNDITFTDETTTYHINDPLAILDELIKDENIKQDNHNKVLTFKTQFIAEISPKGQYGKLNQHDYQLTIIQKHTHSNLIK